MAKKGGISRNLCYTLPATAHLAVGSVEIFVLEGKPFQDTLGLGFNLVTIVGNESVHGGGVPGR